MPVLAILATLALAPRAAAQTRPVEEALTVARADGCLEGSALAPLVASWLGRGEISLDLTVVVEADEGEASFAVLRAGTPGGSRRFERLPASCADRRAVVALAIALALDAAILESIGIAAPSPPAEPPQTPPPPPAAPTPAAPPPPPRGARLAISLEAEGFLTVGLLPEVSAAAALALAGHLGGGARLRAGILATQRNATPLGRGAAELSLLAGRADACYGRSLEPTLALGGCVGALAGAVLATGRDFATVQSVEVPWAAVAGRIELRWMPLDLLALWASVDGLFAILRPRLEVTDGFLRVLDQRTLPEAGLALGLGAALVFE